MQLTSLREPLTLSQLQKYTGGQIVGDASVLITHVKPIEEAGSGAITLIANKEARELSNEGVASGYIVEEKYAQGFEHNGIIVPDGRAAFGIVLGLFAQKITMDCGVSSKATVEAGVSLGKNVTICDYSYIASNATIGDNTIIYPFVFVGPGSKIGKDCLIYPQVVIRENVSIGDRAILHSGVIIGVDGFGFTYTEKGWQKVPQIGGVVIGSDVELFSNTSIASGAAGPTIIEDGVKLGDMNHIGHNAKLGKDSIMAGQSGISGSTTLGQRVKVGGHVMFAGHQKIGDDCGIMAKSLVDGDLEPNQIVSGNPARDHRQDYRIKASMQELPELRKQVKRLSKQLEELEALIKREEN